MFIGRTLRQLRVKNGLTQEQLALRAGVDRSYLSDIERGIKMPTARRLEQLCMALDVRMSVFFAHAESLADEGGMPSLTGVSLEPELVVTPRKKVRAPQG